MSDRGNKILLAVAAAILAVALACFIMFSGQHDKNYFVKPDKAGTVDLLADTAAANVTEAGDWNKDNIWDSPVAQSAGKLWLFEVFTPPVIFFDPRNNQFSVTPPVDNLSSNFPVVKLLAIKPRIYPLQFTGLIESPMGTRETIVFMLTDSRSRQIVRAKLGDFLGQYNIMLSDFSTSRGMEEDAQGNVLVKETAELKVLDATINEEILLPLKGQALAPGHLASVEYMEVPGATARRMELQEGDSITLNNFRITVKSIDPKAGYVTVEVDSDEEQIQLTQQLRPGQSLNQ